MKKDIHPKYYEKAEVICSCGAKFIIGSTVEKTETEICSQCHPFYTGQKKLVDAASRVQKFQNRIKKTSEIKKAKKQNKKQ